MKLLNPKPNHQVTVYCKSNASCTSLVTALAKSSSFFFLGLLHCFLKWPVFPQFQHCTCWLDLDLLLFRLEFLDFDLPRFEFLSLHLPLVSRFKVEPDLEVSSASLRRISSCMIKSRISLYLIFSFPVELLTVSSLPPNCLAKKPRRSEHESHHQNQFLQTTIDLWLY